MPRGFLGLIIELHHPMPPPGEGLGARWVNAAVETYWPLVRACVAAADGGLADVATLAVSPSWAALASDPIGQELTRREITRRRDSAGREGWSHAWHALLEFAAERWSLDPVAALRHVAATGAVELIPFTSSHAWLPAVAQGHVIARAQVAPAVRDFAARFGIPAQGIWLPHLAYSPGFERVLAERGLRYFGVSEQAALGGTARSAMNVFGPLVTQVGAAAFPIDPTSGSPLEDRARHHRQHAPQLDYSAARAAAGEFAVNWVSAWRDSSQARAPRASGPPPINLGAVSAHSIGGSWTLGAQWLEAVLFALAANSEWRPTTPGRYLDQFAEHPLGRPGPAAGGWPAVRPHGSDLLDQLLRASDVLRDAVDAHRNGSALTHRALAQMTRTLLLAESLDWDLPPGAEIGPQRGLDQAATRLQQFAELAGSLAAGRLEPARIAQLEDGPPFLPDLDIADLARD
jgi:predicted glycosyl hydrolase (DUF1957 family)